MDGFDPATSFGPDVARRYDDDPRGDEAETVAFLAGLAQGGPALEFAVGTGRIALPLSARGVRVDGIELSPDMVARLREKPGGDAVDVTMGDMSSVAAPGRLVDRWGGWCQEPFTATSERHVSVYSSRELTNPSG